MTDPKKPLLVPVHPGWYSRLLEHPEGLKPEVKAAMEDALICDRCRAQDGSVRVGPDPFREDIHDDPVVRALCSDCRQGRIEAT